MNKPTQPGKQVNSFWNLIRSSRIMSALIIVLLILLILFMGNQVSWLFTPLNDFFSIVGLPIILAGIFYYLLNPIVDLLEHKMKINRTLTITGVFIIVIALLVWGVWSLIPVINEQLQSLIKSFPSYVDQFNNVINGLGSHPMFQQFHKEVAHFTDMAASELSQRSNEYIKTTVNSLGSVLGTLTTVAIALITMPFILFYLLRDGDRLPHYIAKFVPTRLQSSFLNVLSEINHQISSYIRGQLTVAFFVAIMFCLGYYAIGLKFALTIGIMAGILNLIPYLGSFLAMIPAVIVGLFISPWMLVKVLIVFAIEQTIEGRLLSPLILGINLKIHPVTIIIVLLAAGKMFGVIGVIFGIPGYAVAKVLITHLFNWYQTNSDLYETDDGDSEEKHSEKD